MRQKMHNQQISRAERGKRKEEEEEEEEEEGRGGENVGADRHPAFTVVGRFLHSLPLDVNVLSLVLVLVWFWCAEVAGAAVGFGC